MSENNTQPRPADRYWPTVPPSELGDQIRSRFVEYHSELERRGLLGVWSLVQQVYDGYDPGTGAFASWVTEQGEQGSFLALHVNEFASLVRHQLTLTTSEPLVMDATAANDSPEAEAQASLGKQAIRNYQRAPNNLDSLLVKQSERMFLFGAGYMTQLWDARRGPESLEQDGPAEAQAMPPQDAGAAPSMNAPMPPSGMQQPPSLEPPQLPPQSEYPEPQIRTAGDIVHRVYSPIDIARDLGVRGHDEIRWYVVRERWNKFELAARYPEHATYIAEQPSYDADELGKLERRRTDSVSRTDEIHALRLLHDRTEAVPEGMEVFVVGGRVIGPVLPLAYARMPVHPMLPQEVMDTTIPRAMNWDLLGPQAALNQAFANGLTASDAGSVPKWAIERKTNIDPQTVGPNMRVLYYDAQPQVPNGGIPVLMQTPTMTDGHLKQIDVFKAALQRLSNVNAVARGESEGKSGADNALLAAQTNQNLSSYRKAYVDAARSLGLGIIECLQRFCDRERMIRTFGDDETWSVEYFQGSDLEHVTDVDVDIGDPMTRSFQGRMALADKIADRWPDQVTPVSYMASVITGRWEPIYKAQRNTERLIKAENAKLAKGIAQIVNKADIHAEHIREHLAVLSSPAIREDNKISATVLAHVGEHAFLWGMLTATEPTLLAATGQAPAPQGMQPPEAGGPPPGAEPPRGGPPAPSDAPGSAPRANVGGVEEVGGVPLPQAPQNPATGERAPLPQPGGMS